MSQIGIKDLDYLELLNQTETEEVEGGVGQGFFAGFATGVSGPNFNYGGVNGGAFASPFLGSAFVSGFASAS